MRAHRGAPARGASRGGVPEMAAASPLALPIPRASFRGRRAGGGYRGGTHSSG
jgi:hypothetical protein